MKYQPLRDYLTWLPKSKQDATLRFAEIEKIIGTRLPSQHLTMQPGGATRTTAFRRRHGLTPASWSMAWTLGESASDSSVETGRLSHEQTICHAPPKPELICLLATLFEQGFTFAATGRYCLQAATDSLAISPKRPVYMRMPWMG